MNELYKERLELLSHGESFVLASIFDSQGSAPRKSGARMIIKEDGSIIGTVGGGKVEALVILHGKEIFETKKTVLEEYKLQEADDQGIGMACGGEVSILLEYVTPQDISNILLYQEVVKYMGKNEKANIIRKFYLDGSCVSCLYKNGEVIFHSNALQKEDFSKYSEQLRFRELLCIKEEDGAVLIEPVCNLGRVYLFGAGHVSQKCADLLKKLDFIVTVVDDRAEFANKERFPTADEIIISNSFEGCFTEVAIDKDSYIIILTRGHLFDLTVLEQSLKTDAYYIGMIGSRKKRNVVYDKLKEAGFTLKDFKRVYNPIGLAIGAETPQEIAVSIAAELIKVRRDRIG
jgi:xanthine dehydrogenase accessory factor